jgi:hypothetical protein
MKFVPDSMTLRTMNWRRGLWRLWLALSLCWIVFVFIFFLFAYQGCWWHGCALWPEANMEGIVAYAFIPALLMLGVGLLGAWVVSGFARKGAG